MKKCSVGSFCFEMRFKDRTGEGGVGVYEERKHEAQVSRSE